MTKPLSDKHVDRLIADYLAGSLSEADRPAFEAWLRASPNNPRRVARLSVTDYAMREVCQDTKADNLLDILNQIDDAAGPAQLVTLHNFQVPIWRRYRLPMALGGAIAAVLAIAITLIITLSGPSTDPASIADNSAIEPNDSNDSNEPGPVGPALNTAVATLTATHNAQWDSQPAEDLRRGSKLHPGQRLTLTAGFAEITTNDGAIAILEAPATVEFTHNDNALQLHSGKLVGICETESSKGFVVSTPHMDITDLGTRFGVDATDTRTTEVHVFDGEVAVAIADADETDEPTLLSAGESASTSSFLDKVVKITQVADTFEAMMPKTVQLPGTGSGLAAGEIDPNWQIVAIEGQTLGTPQQLQVSNMSAFVETFPNDPAVSQMIAWSPNTEIPAGGSIAYRFQTQIDLPEDMDAAQTRLVIRYLADNQLASILVNGRRVPVDGPVLRKFNQWQHVVVADHLTVGINTIAFEVHNHYFKTFPTGGPVGLCVDWEWQAMNPIAFE